MTPRIDVVVPIHDPRRPLRRTVDAIRAGSEDVVRITVVVHNTDPAPLAATIAGVPDVRILSLDDGIRSPAGPMNLGFESATAPWLSVIGSDDTVEPGAYTEWLSFAEATSADVVIPRLRHSDGRPVMTPPTRPFRRTGLDGVRDRLSYRSAPLGIFSRARFGTLRMPEGIATGEDIPFVMGLWFSNARIGYHRGGPAYVIQDDADSRISFTARPLAEEFAWLAHVEASIGSLTREQRQALVAKLLRVNLFGAIANRPGMWQPDERLSLAHAAQGLVAIGAGIERVLSRADRKVLDLALDADSPSEDLDRAALVRRRFLRPASLLPPRLRYTFAREGALRTATASLLQR